MVTIIKIDKDEYVALQKNEHGWGYQLHPIVELEWKAKDLVRKHIRFEVVTDKELRETNRALYTIYQVLKILEDTTDGNMGSPWLKKETFEELLYEFQDFSEWNAKNGMYYSQQKKYERI